MKQMGGSHAYEMQVWYFGEFKWDLLSYAVKLITEDSWVTQA